MIAKATFRPAFPELGKLLITPGTIEALQESGQLAIEFLRRHAAGDWGDLDDDDQQANRQALETGARLLSAYHTKKGRKLWVITEAVSDDGKRAATTILLPEEY